MLATPVRLEAVAAWELRAAWAALREVVVTWVHGDDVGRVRGYVVRVAATGAFAEVWDGRGDVHVPLGLVAAIRRPHYSSPEDGAAVAPPPPREEPGWECADQLAFVFEPEQMTLR